MVYKNNGPRGSIAVADVWGWSARQSPRLQPPPVLILIYESDSSVVHPRVQIEMSLFSAPRVVYIYYTRVRVRVHVYVCVFVRMCVRIIIFIHIL
jgi:hypothetical protein